jgi:hypothetical protein
MHTRFQQVLILWLLGCSSHQKPVVLAPVAMTISEASLATPQDTTRTQESLRGPRGFDWPAPNRYRSADGEPGPEYWQQRADYSIAATLDTGLKKVSGTVRIRYTNNSPDTLRLIWLQLDQNLYRTGSKGAALYSSGSRWGVRGFEGGYQLNNVRVGGTQVEPKINDTMMRLDLPAPLPPRGGALEIGMEYAFVVPEHGSDRMGRDGQLYEIAQWYPRMAVYDDVRGWNTDPYLGQGEFYLEYGDIDYAITVPAGFTVAGSGMLDNVAEVLTSDQRERLERAKKSSTVVSIITAAEAKARQVDGSKTWRFRATNVRDVAWAAAPDFRWDATSWNGILCQSYYQFPKAGKSWESAAEQTQWTIKHYSETFFAYPYPQATSVAGPVGGMEYPMFVMVHYGSGDPASIFGTLNHEHGHQWFPMIVGSNERRYAWQDEGINTYINAFATEARYPGSEAFTDYYANWRDIVSRGIQSPLMTMPDAIHPSALGAIGYRKPAVVLLTLRNHVVGAETFDRAFHEYIRRWAFKHPTPADFFRTIENVSGEDLDWFWTGFFYSNDVLDIAVDSVVQSASGGAQSARVILRKTTSIPFPVSFRVKYADGTTQDFKFPVQVWTRASRFEASIAVVKAIVGVRLWTESFVPDWNSTNDRWGDAPAVEPLKGVTRQ